MGKIRLGVVVVAIACAVFAPASPLGAPAGAAEPTPVLRIDAGGAGVAGTPTWQKDSASAPSPLGNGAQVGAAQVRSTTSAIDMTNPSVPAGTPVGIFRSVRIDPQGTAPNLTYGLPTTATTARVRLFFVELDGTVRTGGRLFDVYVEGRLVDKDLDIYARTGGALRGLVRTYDIGVAGTNVDVQLRWKKKPPMIAALELLTAPPEPPPPGVAPVVRVDTGGAGAAGTPGWSTDSAAAPSPLGNGRAVGADQVATSAAAVIDTSSSSLPPGTPESVVRTVRVDKNIAQPDLAYVLPVDRAGTYVVRAYFVEIHTGYVGSTSRVEDVWVNGLLVDDNLDIAGRAGGVSKAFARTYTVTVPDHQPAIQVEVTKVRQAPAIAAVELLSQPLEPIDRPGTWTATTSGPTLGEDAFTGAEGYLYRAGGQIFAGYQQVISTSQHDRYDPRTGEWTALPALPTAVDHIQGIYHQGRIWYVGGTTGGVGTGVTRGPTGQVTSYDPATGELTSHAPMPRPRGAGGVAALDGKIYVFGGLVTPNQQSPQADVYDIATDTWSQLPDLPMGKDHFKAAVIGTDIYLPGGRLGTAATAMNRFDVYDTVTGTYRSAAPLPVALGGAGLGVLDGKLVMAGGETRAPDAARREVFSYDPATNSWTQLESMLHPRHGLDLVPCGNALYVTGGMGNFGATNVNSTGEVFTLDGAPANCPLATPPPVEEGLRPSVLDVTTTATYRRAVAAAAATRGTRGIYCAI